MRLGFDFELSENRRRSENYVRPAYDPYPIPESEPHAQKPIPENETHAQKPIPEIYKPKPITKADIDHAEKIDAEWSAIHSMLKVAYICEAMAKRYRNLGDFNMEECYLDEANHAQEAANLLYILTHK